MHQRYGPRDDLESLVYVLLGLLLGGRLALRCHGALGCRRSVQSRCRITSTVLEYSCILFTCLICIKPIRGKASNFDLLSGLPWSVGLPAPNGIWSDDAVHSMLADRCRQWDNLCQIYTVPIWLQQMHNYARSLLTHEMPNYKFVHALLTSASNDLHSAGLQHEE